jgi:dihydropteroate synthase
MVQLVGILNITPDSFSDGGKFYDTLKAIEHARLLFKDGASLVDVGAESTRPKAELLDDETEWLRLEGVLSELLIKYPVKISLDSYHPATIRKAYSLGPVIINDVTGFNDPEMVKLVLELKPPKVIISHLPLMTVAEAHEKVPIRKVSQVKNDLVTKAKELETGGLDRSQIILDPGIGFGKTPELNKELLRFAEQVPDYDVMIGYSRKRFLGEDRMKLAPNLEAGKIAVASGAKYLRVHDVAGHNVLLG